MASITELIRDHPDELEEALIHLCGRRRWQRGHGAIPDGEKMPYDPVTFETLRVDLKYAHERGESLSLITYNARLKRDTLVHAYRSSQYAGGDTKGIYSDTRFHWPGKLLRAWEKFVQKRGWILMTEHKGERQERTLWHPPEEKCRRCPNFLRCHLVEA